MYWKGAVNVLQRCCKGVVQRPNHKSVHARPAPLLEYENAPLPPCIHPSTLSHFHSVVARMPLRAQAMIDPEGQKASCSTASGSRRQQVWTLRRLSVKRKTQERGHAFGGTAVGGSR
eukprot:40685-Chlamydomonas_euryale.AAC.1